MHKHAHGRVGRQTAKWLLLVKINKQVDEPGNTQKIDGKKGPVKPRKVTFEPQVNYLQNDYV